MGAIGLIVLFFSFPSIEYAFNSWRSAKKHKNYVEGELERLVNNYGLKIQNPTAEFNSCEYRYVLYKSKIMLGHLDKDIKKLKNKDFFMVNCIPFIREIEKYCDDQMTERVVNSTYNFSDESCWRDTLDQFAIEN